MFAISLCYDQHTRHYSIQATGPSGWEVRLQEDETLKRLDHYRDWHRVERVLASFEREALELVARGWSVAQQNQSMNR